MNRKICVVTGTRAEYGLLQGVMSLIRDAKNLDLQVVVTGAHLSPEFGLTYQEIESDGFVIDRKIEMLLSADTSTALAKSMGLGLIGFGEALQQLQPDLLVILGDRYEIFAAVSAALVARIPVAHIHGGETTEGAFDESLRHSITKMSHLHFAAADEYRNRIIQLGEQPQRVFNVGGLGVDNVNIMPLLGKTELEDSLDFKFGAKNLLITFHPVTLENNSSTEQMEQLLEALDVLEGTQLLFTMPNADTDSRALVPMIQQFVSTHTNAKAYTSLGALRYLSCVKQVDGVVGNSSSGLLEVPSLGTGTVNIGDRQRGRLKAASVIDCKPDKSSIGNALCELYSEKFKARLSKIENPYGEGGASKKIVQTLQGISFDGLLKKTFYDGKHPVES